MTDKKDKKDFKKFNRENRKNEVIGFFLDLFIIFIVVIIIRTFLILPFQVIGESMMDSYYDREFIIVDRLSYRFTEPKRGDVIVFKPNVSDEKEYFIKRIIGLPGDKLKIEDGKVYLYSEEKQKYIILKEGYHNYETIVGGDRRAYEYTVPDGSFFVMGDNRPHSTDSRECFSRCNVAGATNYVTKEYIIGKVWLDLGYFSLSNKIGFINKTGVPSYPKFFSSPSTYDYSDSFVDEDIKNDELLPETNNDIEENINENTEEVSEEISEVSNDVVEE